MAYKYITHSCDTWDLIAYQQLGSESYMRLLMETNRQYADVLRFDGGTEITIPDLPNPDTSNLPFWRSDDSNIVWGEEVE